MFTIYIYGQGDFQTNGYNLTGIIYVLCMGIAFMTLSMLVYTVHVTCQDIDGVVTEADGGANAPVGPSVATYATDQQTYHTIRMAYPCHHSRIQVWGQIQSL